MSCMILLCDVCGCLGEDLGSEDWVVGKSVGYGARDEVWRGEISLLSWQPRLYHLKGFLTDWECEHLKELGLPKLKRTNVLNSTTGEPEPSSVRTSEGTFIGTVDNVVAMIEQRVAHVTMLPKSHQEIMQILRYKAGQKYLPHHDYFKHEPMVVESHGGQRLITFLMYLSSPLEGGETIFPWSNEKVEGPGWSECAKRGFSVKARKGDAVMFYALHPNGTEDKNSLHGSCPTLAGEKWSATKWIRQGPLPHK